MTVHQFEQPRLVDVAGEHRAILQHVDAQQGGFQAEVARQAMQGRARSEHITHAVFPAFRQPIGEVHQHQFLGLHPCLLHVLHEVALLRHRHLAVPTRGDAAGAQRLFVEVAHLAAGQAHQAALDQAPGQFAGRARTDGIDPGVDLHPGRNAEHRLLLAHHPGNIPCCAITTGEQDQGDTGLLQTLDRQRVSAALLTAPCHSPSRRWQKPMRSSNSPPMAPGKVRNSIFSTSGNRHSRAIRVRSSARGSAPLARASAATPSLPFKATGPPSPARD